MLVDLLQWLPYLLWRVKVNAKWFSWANLLFFRNFGSLWLCLNLGLWLLVRISVLVWS